MNVNEFTIELGNANTGQVVDAICDVNIVRIILASGQALTIYATNDVNVVSCIADGSDVVVIQPRLANAFYIEVK